MEKHYTCISINEIADVPFVVNARGCGFDDMDILNVIRLALKIDLSKDPESQATIRHRKTIYDISSIYAKETSTQLMTELKLFVSSVLDNIRSSSDDLRAIHVSDIIRSSRELYLILVQIRTSNNYMLDEFAEYLKHLNSEGRNIPTEYFKLIDEFKNNGSIFLDSHYEQEMGN